MIKYTLLLFSVFVFNVSVGQISDFKSIDFTEADNVAKLYKGSDLNNLQLLAHRLTFKFTTEAEKFRAIYTWVCNNIKGDSYLHNKVSRKRSKLKNDSLRYVKWNTKYKKTIYKNLFEDKKTMCTGYAFLIKELCFFANIECKIVDGYGRSVSSNVDTLEKANHSWNAVKLNNKWYLCDATWSSGYMISETLFLNDYNDGYFLTEPTLFAKNHYPLQKEWLLNNTSTASGFTTAPLVYGDTFKNRIAPISPNKMNVTINKEECITFSFKNLESNSNDKVSLVKFIGNNEHAFKIYDLKTENSITSFKHQFNRKGFYDVHLKINNDIVATYTIEVTKS
ncbi:transglutaminase domain-containing protein [Lacinutrix sp.]|uniref:transglutaminase domain-containing protein n=1 Tax=Lacinutrix sp. TaxID=1937692 RepID=UPI0025C4F325|nr:transglutaminase domain-containing protein [Lacinutrix sp.]